MKTTIANIQIPWKRSHSGYQGSDAMCERAELWSDCANLTADFVQNTSQHENANAIATTIVKTT